MISRNRPIPRVLTAWALPLWAAIAVLAYGGERTDDLLFQASFDTTLAADIAAGDTRCLTPPAGQGKIRFVPGLKGQAATGGMAYATAGNVLPRQGTVLLWVQPLTWQADDDIQVNFFSIGHGIRDGQSATALQLYKYHRVNPAHSGQMWINSKLNVFAARADEVDGKVVSRRDNKLPVDITGWQIGDWHHLALSWSRATGLVKLYVDGFAKGSAKMPLPDAFTDRFTFGDAAEAQTTAFDEVRIYKRPLTLDEVRAVLLAEKP